MIIDTSALIAILRDEDHAPDIAMAIERAEIRRISAALLDFQHKAPAAHTAHPRTEHFAPLFVTLGAGENDLAVLRQPIEGFWGGLAKRSVQFG